MKMLPKRVVYKYLISIFTVSILIKEGQGHKGDGNCELFIEDDQMLSYTEWSRVQYLEAVNDTIEPYAEIISLKTADIQEITNYQVTPSRENFEYLYFILDESTEEFKILSGSNFNQYEESETSLNLKFDVEFQCKNGKNSLITFQMPIKDTNNHDPILKNAPYEYKLSMPVPQGFQIDIDKRIVVRDVDLTNNYVTLNLYDENINNIKKLAVYSTGQEKKDIKNYLTSFITLTSLDLEDDITFTLFATDSKQPSRTTNTTVKLIIDKTNSNPRFSHVLYTANITHLDCKKSENVILPFAESDIILTRGYTEDVVFYLKDISEENKKHFILSHDYSSNAIITYVRINNLTEEFLNQKTLTVVLVATRRGAEANTILQILLREVSSNELILGNKENPNNNSIVQEIVSTNGLMIVTLILSIISITLVVYIIFLFLNRQR